MFWSGNTTLIISNGEVNDVANEAKDQIVWFLKRLLGTLGAILSGNLLTGKGKIKVGEGTIRASQDF